MLKAYVARNLRSKSAYLTMHTVERGKNSGPSGGLEISSGYTGAIQAESKEHYWGNGASGVAGSELK